MANEQNLIPRPFKSGEQARRMGRKGGLSRSPKKKWAARLRHLKKKGLTDENYQILYAMMTEKESFVLDNLLYLQNIKKDCKTTGEKANVARILNDLLSKTHGEVLKTENIHHVVNWGDIFKNAEIRPEKDSK